MSEQPRSLKPITLDEDDYFRVIEERRRAAEGVLWQLPSISLAAQAFLLGTGLDPNATPSSQIFVGSLGIAAVVGTVLIVLYQALRASIFERWLSQTVCQPLRPDELVAETSELNPWGSWSVARAYKIFRRVCAVALFVFLAADVYVLCRGIMS